MEKCFYEMFEQQATLQPEAPAIAAWDGDFTYSQLNDAADRLARLLVRSYGVKTEELIHVCFDKSAWHFVAILAINKAGAAWAPLNPSHSVQRQQQIVNQTQARLALASETNTERCQELRLEVIVLTSTLDENLATEGGIETDRALTIDVGPRNIAYVLFTPGSTGTPKGLLMDHGAVCSSGSSTARRLGLTAGVRLLQFASFVFDLSIGEIISPLISGACICIPSEHDRINNLDSFVRSKAANWAYLTPSFVRTLRPVDFPSLELLILAGEAVS